MTIRTDIINYLIAHTRAMSYLEIGSGHHVGFNEIMCPIKHDIEPYPGPGVIPTYQMTSDEAFLTMPEELIYDVIFIDGLHQCDQVARDTSNAIKHLNPRGFIVIHDCMPETEVQQSRICPGAVSWNGDVWKFQAWLVSNFESVWTIPENWGCGIIYGRINFQVPNLDELLSFQWDQYKQNKNKLLRIVEWDVFKTFLKHFPCNPSRGVIDHD